MYLRRAALWGEGQRLVREVNGCGAQLPRATRSSSHGSGRRAVTATRSRSSSAGSFDPIWSRPVSVRPLSSSCSEVRETSGNANAERDGYTAFTVGTGHAGLTVGLRRIGHLQCGPACRPGGLRRLLAAGHADRLLVDLATTSRASTRACSHGPPLQGDSLASRFATVCRSARSMPRRKTNRS